MFYLASKNSRLIQRRLDFWLISNSLQAYVVSVDIKPSIKSDLSAITLLINSVDEREQGPKFLEI